MEIYDLGKYPLTDEALVLAEEKSLPNADNADSNSVDLGESYSMGEALVAIDLDAEITVAATKLLTFKIMQSADNSSWDTHYLTLTLPPATYSAQRFLVGLGSPKRYVKINADATGDQSGDSYSAAIINWDRR